MLMNNTFVKKTLYDFITYSLSNLPISIALLDYLLLTPGFHVKNTIFLLSFYDHIHILSCIIFIDDSLPLGPLIAIIIIVVIIVFIVIDVTCYFKRKCGVFMCIKERVTLSTFQ
jgi:hypothetical protein